VAPEIDGHLALVKQMADAGIRVQIGHTNGTYEDGVAALAQGAAGFTHLFNAMPGLHHREPGMAGAALAHAQYAEIIPDLLHVHPGAIKVALRSIPKLFCVTDSTAAAGMPDGEYMLGRQTVHKCMGGVRLADGTLAGSTLTMDQALRNLVDRPRSKTPRAACPRMPPTTSAKPARTPGARLLCRPGRPRPQPEPQSRLYRRRM
jgi:N-acetylglucosamine-6-phosphate deacetylase